MITNCVPAFRRQTLIDQNKEKDISYDDVNQGAIGDCYFVAALSAVLYADNDHTVRDGLIREVEGSDGRVARFAVRFYDYKGVPQDVEVDAQIIRSGSGRPTYARSADSVTGQEEWAISLVEKAYAQWRGDYTKIGNGGYAGDVMQALTGATATYREAKNMTDDEIVSSITASMADSRPVTACTFGEDSGVDYSGSGVHAWHCYSVHGAGIGEDRQTMVTLRNPWGVDEPAGNGPDDGIFKLKTSDFRRLYQGINYGGRGSVDVVAPGKVTDLDMMDPIRTGVTLGFTAPGDDGARGMAFGYDLRISREVITNDNFYSATAAPIGGPLAPGEVEFVDVTGLEAGTWYAAIKTEDEAGNVSPLSNVPSFDVAAF